MTATISVNAQLVPKDTTVTHDSTIFKLTQNIKHVPYDSAYKTPIRDTSVLVPIMTFDTTKIVDKVSCTSRRRWWSNRVVIKCDTTWKNKYDTTTTLVLQPTKTLPRDTVSSFCCVDSIWYTQTPQKISTTHDSVVYINQDVKIKYGLKINQDNFNNQLNVAQQIGLISIRPSSISIRDFNGDLGNVIKWKQSGLYTVMNWNWIDNPSEKPYNFVSGADTVKFKTNFERACQAAVGIVDLIVIENEPANLQYYNWKSNTDASDYIHELKMAIAIAHKYGLKISDGCCHLELIELIRTNQWQSNDAAIRDKTLMDNYKTLALDYADFHTSYDINRRTGAYPVNDLKTTIDYYGTYTGHQPYTNEYSMQGGTPTQVTWFVNGWKAAKIPIAIAWSGDNTKSDAYNLGTTLTPIGIQYKTDIK